MDYPSEPLRQILTEVERGYPDEACGLVFHGPGGLRVAPVENVVDRYHAKDPVRFPRTARTAYLMDPRRQLEAMERADVCGERLVAVYHSHADVGAYFSEEDRAQALSAGGEPLLPGVEYLVLSVRDSRCDAISCFRYQAGAWEARSLEVPLTGSPGLETL